MRELAAARIIALHPASGGGVMIVVIFEVIPNEGRAHEYFDLAQELAPELDKIDGFISVERFESLADKGKFLSLSTWRDEAAVAAWYHHSGHRKAQAKGKARIFKDFRIRVAAVLRDYDLASRRIKPVPTDAETPASQ